MQYPGITAVLVVALVAPIVLFWSLRSRARWKGLRAGGTAIAVGWALNVAWAWLVQRAAAAGGAPADGGALAGDMPAGELLSMAAMFGWFCPAVLVLLTALAWQLLRGRRRNG